MQNNDIKGLSVDFESSAKHQIQHLSSNKDFKKNHFDTNDLKELLKALGGHVQKRIDELKYGDVVLKVDQEQTFYFYDDIKLLPFRGTKKESGFIVQAAVNGNDLVVHGYPDDSPQRPYGISESKYGENLVDFKPMKK